MKIRQSLNLGIWIIWEFSDISKEKATLVERILKVIKIEKPLLCSRA